MLLDFARRAWRAELPLRYAAISALFIVAWPIAVMFCDMCGLDASRAWLAEAGLWTVFLAGLGWTVWGIERASQFYVASRRTAVRAGEAPPEEDHAQADAYELRLRN